MNPARTLDLRARAHPAYWAFVVHRLSGVLLTLFLPLHFLFLGQALHGEAALQGALRWTEQPLVKLGEIAVVLALAAHLAGGVRILALEFLPWRDWQKTLAATARAATLGLGVLFALATGG